MQDAKDSFIEALTIDVKNYEAFRELVEGEMMQPQEGEHLLASRHYTNTD